MAKFEIKKAKNDQFYFNLKAGNGQIVLTSEMYTTKASSQKGIASIQKNCSDDNCFDRKVASNGKLYFNLKAANHEIIGSSQMYVDKGGMENGIDSVKTNAPDASIEDLC